MAYIMASYSLYSTRLCTTIHLVMHIGLGQWKDSVRILQSVNHSHIFLHFITQKLWYFYGAVTLWCFWGGNHIFALQSLIGFVNRQFQSVKVKICWCECQHFPQSKTTPV